MFVLMLGCFCSVFILYLNLKLLNIGESISSNQIPFYIYSIEMGKDFIQNPNKEPSHQLVYKYCYTLPSLLFILPCMTLAVYVTYNNNNNNDVYYPI